MQLVNIENGFSLIENDKVVFSHTIDNPAIFIGKGKEKMDIYRGNFDIEDYVIEKISIKKMLKLMVIKYYYQLIMMQLKLN